MGRTSMTREFVAPTTTYRLYYRIIKAPMAGLMHRLVHQRRLLCLEKLFYLEDWILATGTERAEMESIPFATLNVMITQSRFLNSSAPISSAGAEAGLFIRSEGDL